MSIYPQNPENILKAAGLIRQGAVIAFPTETVYGLGADAFNAAAAARIFEIKNRPYFDPLIVHVATKEDVLKIAEFPESAARLTAHFWPGPLTVVLKKKAVIPDLITSGLPSVAVRMPNHPAALELIRAAGTPVAAPSANPFGYLSPTTAAHVEKQLGNKVDFILDGGPCGTGVESTIVDFSGGKPALLRPGGIPLEEIEKITGRLEIRKAGERPSAPGQLEQHYAPRKPLKILSRTEMEKNPQIQKAGVLLASAGTVRNSKVSEVLSDRGDLKEIAANLFAALHRLDQAAIDVIFAEPVPENGLGLAIMDRLRRAAATFRH